MGTIEQAVDVLRLFGDPTRVRLAALLERHELTVAEITRITSLPQSRVSTHLGKLREAGVLRDRRDGASTFYSMNNGDMPEALRQLWTVVGGTLHEPLVRADRERSLSVVAARSDGKTWADRVAGQMERHYSPGRTWESTARSLLGFLRLGEVLDAGSGDGAIAELLAPRARQITCLDRSAHLVEAARRRLGHLPNVAFSPGDIHALPFPGAHFDQVLMLHVLVYADDPAQAVAEAARVLRPGGSLVVTTLAPHDHHAITESFGHVHTGLAPAQLAAWLTAAHLEVELCAVTSREQRPPHFEVITAFAQKPAAA